MADFHPNAIPHCGCKGPGPQDHLCCQVVASDLVAITQDRNRWEELAKEYQAQRDRVLEALREVVGAIDVLAERAAEVGWIDKDQQVEVLVNRARALLSALSSEDTAPGAFICPNCAHAFEAHRPALSSPEVERTQDKEGTK